MKRIKFEDAHAILLECSAVVWDDWRISRPLCDEEKLLVKLEHNDSGLIYSAVFDREFNRTVAVEGSSMFMFDEDGEEVQLTVLNPSSAEIAAAPAV